jgi:hypothetical protein
MPSGGQHHTPGDGQAPANPVACQNLTRANTNHQP